MDGTTAIADLSDRGDTSAPIDHRFELDQSPLRVTGATAMRQLGSKISEGLRIGDVILLQGELGAGKTTLTQGIAAGLSIPEAIQSPTFGLVAEHDGVASDGTAIRLYHLDLFRIEDPEELESIGFDQYADPDDGITVIEWPERAIGWLPDRYLFISIGFAGQDRRRVSVRSAGDEGPIPQLITR